MAFKRIKFGDVFEIKTKKGFAYMQCVKETPATESEIVRILPGIFDSENEAHLDELVNAKELFFIQFPLKYAERKKIVKLVGNYQVPERAIAPRYYRDKEIIKGEFKCWYIIDSQTLKRKSVTILSSEEKKLSPWGMWNDTLLIERIDEGWTPEKWV